MSAPTPLPTTAGILKTEPGGGSLGAIPPDRFTDHAGAVLRVLEVKWMNDKSGKWSKTRQVSLGSSTGETRITRSIQPMGTYRTRQFELVFSDACAFCLVAVEDIAEVLK